MLAENMYKEYDYLPTNLDFIMGKLVQQAARRKRVNHSITKGWEVQISGYRQRYC